MINFTTYNARGEPDYQIQAVANATRGITDYATLLSSLSTILSGPDRVTRAVQSVIAATGGKPDLTRNDQYVWNDGSSSGVLISRSESSTDGLESWQTTYPTPGVSLVSSNVTLFAGSGLRYSTNIVADGSHSVTTLTNGRAISSAHFDSLNSQLSASTQGYDTHGRPNTTTDARNGTTISTFNAADMTVTSTTPAPGNVGSAQTTLSYFDASLRAWKITQPDGSSVTNEFWPTGLIKRTYGSRNYPVGYGYDPQLRMTTMTNWTNFATSAGARVTTWNYNPYHGWLDNKRYADGNGPDYTYTPGGRLKTRKWARTGTGGNRILTTYGYGFEDTGSDHQHGDLISIVYSYDPQNTPSVYFVPDRRGRQTNIASGTSTNLIFYYDIDGIINETNKTGTLAGLSITNGFDQFFRKTNVVSLNPSTALTRHSFGYDGASRMSSATDNSGATAYSATYSYLANSPLINQIVMKSGSTTRLTVSKQFDRLNRLQVISNAPSAASSLAFNYALNDANQRTQTHLQDNSFWVYNYDSLGQVISGKKYWSDWTPVAGQQFEYGFDDIGNRNSTKAGGDETGANLRSVTYSANSLNQYTSRTVPNAFDVIGLELSTNSVTVNSATPYRHGEYFRKEISVINSSTSVWQSVTVSAPSETSVNGNVFVAKSPESFGYDLDGNLTNDGRFSLTWDAENRLTLVQSLTNGPQASWRKVAWEFDGKGRRVRQTSYDGSNGSYVVTEDLKFLADGWRHVAELNATNNALVRSYLWGLDLSGSTDGAGGVGGLILMNSAANGVHFAMYDGNGNVAGLVKASDGAVSASYEYGPFGETLRSTGAEAREMPFRFSTKRTDSFTDLVIYDRRIYAASSGKWLSLDPVGEQGGGNLYGFVENSPVSRCDAWGLASSALLYNAIQKINKEFSDSAAAQSTGYKRTLRRLMSVIPLVNVRIGDPGTGASGVYDPWTDTITLPPSYSQYTVLHELVHAWVEHFAPWIDAGKLYPFGRENEGMAYSLSLAAQLSVEHIVLTERAWRKDIPAHLSDRKYLTETWHGEWSVPGTPISTAMPESYPPGGLDDRAQTPFRLTWEDFERTYGYLGFHVTCDGYARVLNGILESKGSCYRVTCNEGDMGTYNINPGRPIHPVFRGRDYDY